MNHIQKYPENWFEQIESSLIKQYKFLKIKGDVDNSVLAGFVLYNSQENSLSVLSLGTGTKLMSGDQRQKTSKIGPALIHDCHAEILSHRGLQAWIWDNLENDSIFERKGDEYHLHPHLSLHFYSSDPPCGDCCVHSIKEIIPSHQEDNTDKKEDITDTKESENKYIESIRISVQTGAKPFGWDQSQLFTSPPNIVRGKPGRGSRSQSVSCSDKITLWIHAGLQGSFLSNIVPNLNLSSILVGNGCIETLHRAFIDRIYEKENSEVKNVDIDSLKIFVGKPSWEEKNLSPCASSFVWWKGSSQTGELIAAKFGRKQGVIEKKQEDPRMFSGICDARMLQRFCKYNKINHIKFGDAKKKCENYLEKKEKIKNILESYGGQWATKFPEEKEWEYKE